MITGDAILTAAEVARKVNIVSSDPASTWELLVDENSGEISEWRTMNHSSEDGSAVRTMPYTHEATHESVLTNMRLKGNEFCMVSERSERALRKTSILAMNPANGYRHNIMATSTNPKIRFAHLLVSLVLH
jgi:magnesium-transporting ATPase (P-type)